MKTFNIRIERIFTHEFKIQGQSEEEIRKHLGLIINTEVKNEPNLLDHAQDSNWLFFDMEEVNNGED